MATTIRHALEDESLRQSLAAQGPHQAQRFSWQRTAAETLALYRQVIHSLE